jgi:hypothetical protein
MADDIFIIQDNGTLIEMNQHDYDSEGLLQGLLAKYPKLLAGGQINSESPRHWLLVKREMGIAADEDKGGRWSVDHLFLDQDAIPTLVEVKRSTDTRIRREVVGQMLDYAANAVVYWPVEQLRAEFEKNCSDPQGELDKLLDGSDPEDFWKKVKTNLQAGKIRLLFVADVIPPELRRIVEFLNKQMDPAEVLAVEIRQYIGQGMKTLVPRVIGQTAEAEGKKGGGTFDKTKYRFEGQLLGKSRLVLSVIRKHSEAKPQTTFSDLEKAFPKNLQGSFGCFETAEKATEIWKKSGRKRHFLSPEEIIALKDAEIAVCTQWGIGNIGSFLDTAKELGYCIEEVGDQA